MCRGWGGVACCGSGEGERRCARCSVRDGSSFVRLLVLCPGWFLLCQVAGLPQGAPRSHLQGFLLLEFAEGGGMAWWPLYFAVLFLNNVTSLLPDTLNAR